MRGSARPWYGLLMVALAGLVWGTIAPAVQLAVARSGLSPLTVSAYRALVAVVLLLLAVLVSRRWAQLLAWSRRHRRRVLTVGVLTAAFQLLFFAAVGAAGVSVSTVVCMGFAPAFLLVVASVRRRRLPSGAALLTVVMAVAGLLLICLAGGGHEHASNPAAGILAALAAGAAFALSADLAAPLTRRSDPLAVTVTTMTVAGVVLVPFGFAIPAGHAALATSDAVAWLLICYLAVAMVLAWALMFVGLRTASSEAAVVATLLEPVTAVAIAVLFLGERLTLAGLLGALLIVSAIAILGRVDHVSEPVPGDVAPVAEKGGARSV